MISVLAALLVFGLAVGAIVLLVAGLTKLFGATW